MTYPDGGPSYDKWDYFSIPDEELPEMFRENPDPNRFYDFLNNSGYWDKGWQEITEEMDEWIDSHPDVQGEQDEVAVEVDFI